MKVLHVAPSYYPATFWGGPIWSTKAICDAIAADPDVTLRVLTTDAAGPQVGDRVTPAALPYPVHYARRIAGHSFAPGLVARLPAAIAWADVVHLTATYNTPTLPTLMFARLLNRPVVWSPRGALQATHDWDAAPRKRAKAIFERVANVLRPRDTVLHVTAQIEAARSVDRLRGITQVVIPNCVEVTADVPRVARRDGKCRLVFLSRVHPKKGLGLLFDAMSQLPTSFSLDVYGTGPAEYVAELGARAATFGGRIRMHGHVDGPAKTQAFANADLFVLPTFSENFGIAVAEAMAHGLPVLTTTGTPWQDTARFDCGRCIDLKRDNLATEIQALSLLDLPAMGARGRHWMRHSFSSDAMVADFSALYRDLCAAHPRKGTACAPLRS